MNIYKCKRGDICLTGDSYGMGVCLVLGQKYCENFGGDVVIFADVIDGTVHESGYKGSSTYSDDCHFIKSTSEEKVIKFVDKWNIVCPI